MNLTFPTERVLAEIARQRADLPHSCTMAARVSLGTHVAQEFVRKFPTSDRTLVGQVLVQACVVVESLATTHDGRPVHPNHVAAILGIAGSELAGGA